MFPNQIQIKPLTELSQLQFHVHFSLAKTDVEKLTIAIQYQKIGLVKYYLEAGLNPNTVNSKTNKTYLEIIFDEYADLQRTALTEQNTNLLASKQKNLITMAALFVYNKPAAYLKKALTNFRTDLADEQKRKEAQTDILNKIQAVDRSKIEPSQTAEDAIALNETEKLALESLRASSSSSTAKIISMTDTVAAEKNVNNPGEDALCKKDLRELDWVLIDNDSSEEDDWVYATRP